ncbi:MAG: lysoplasmalogenase [Bifidobacteriaceae bacterium]|jgi:hypothetical protein|nr:lysoplasmalogenase [Bifidobacteriaceae bacterium]
MLLGLLGALGAIVVIVYISRAVKGPSPSALIGKAASGLVFVLTGAAAAYMATLDAAAKGAGAPGVLCFALLILGGLVCGLLGDIGLDLNGLMPDAGAQPSTKTSGKEPASAAPPTYMVAGIASFALGHILYISALIWYWRPPWWALAGGLLVAAIFAASLSLGGRRWLGLEFGSLMLPSAVYGFILASMATIAWACCLTTGGSAALVIAAGGTLFLASDIVLCFELYRPVKAKPAHTATVLVLYYAAQFTIAVSPLALA